MPTARIDPDEIIRLFALRGMHPVGYEPVSPIGETGCQSEKEHWLTVPPSVNNLFFSTAKGRSKSKEYRYWTTKAVKRLRGWKWEGQYPVSITFTVRETINQRRDLDNLLKPLSDSLVKAGVIIDDCVKYVVSFQVQYRPGTGRGVLIEIEQQVT